MCDDLISYLLTVDADSGREQVIFCHSAAHPQSICQSPLTTRNRCAADRSRRARLAVCSCQLRTQVRLFLIAAVASGKLLTDRQKLTRTLLHVLMNLPQALTIGLSNLLSIILNDF